MKPADKLRHEAGAYYAAQDCAALLDECERVLAEIARLSDKWGEQGPLVTDARATLAKLRGQA